MSMKTVGAAGLVAGTAIGAGTLALPQLVASMGPAMACGFFVVSWWVVYIMCLCTADLHIAVGGKHSFARMCESLGGGVAAFVASIAFLLMGFALMSAYSVGLVDLGRALCPGVFKEAWWFFVAAILFFVCGKISIVERVNRYALSVALVLLFCFCVVFFTRADIVSVWIGVAPNALFSCRSLPAIFTSFGCQIVVAPLVDYCDLRRDQIRRAFFYGTLVPLVLYCVWVVSALAILRSGDLWGALHRGDAVALAQVMDALAHGSGLGGLVHWLQGV